MTRTGDREIGVVSGRLLDNTGELACMMSLTYSLFNCKASFCHSVLSCCDCLVDSFNQMLCLTLTFLV